jgi:hypothetical protein
MSFVAPLKIVFVDNLIAFAAERRGVGWSGHHLTHIPKLAEHAVYYTVTVHTRGFGYVMQINLMKLITLKKLCCLRGWGGKAGDVHSPSARRLHGLQTDASNVSGPNGKVQ